MCYGCSNNDLSSLLQPPGPGVRESSQLGSAGSTEVEVILKVRIIQRSFSFSSSCTITHA